MSKATARRFSHSGITIFVLLYAAFPPVLYAYEEDVHYGLTKCIALEVGFSEPEAESIALANQTIDDDRNTSAVWRVARDIILSPSDKRAANASMLVRQFHFPSDMSPPAPPANRKVSHNSQYSKEFVSLSRILEHLGEALHSAQDSWSHQGIPDTPLRPCPAIRTTYVWAHPENRGGWWRHAADLTYQYEKDILPMAQMTHDALLQFRIQQGKKQSPQEDKDWDKLKGLIGKFAHADTKEAKREWFAKSCPRVEQLAFLTKINLEDGNGFSQYTPSGVGNVGSILFRLISDRTPPAKLWEFAAGFLKNWFVDKNEDALKAAIDEAKFRTRLACLGIKSSDDILRLFVMWVVQDHGSVERLGHGVPIPERSDSIPSSFSRLGGRFRPVNYHSLAEALKTDSEGVAVDLYRVTSSSLLLDSGNEVYAAVFQPNHLAHDSLTLLIEQALDSNWKISGMFWISA